jgi:neutral amino acid transport system permease protein
VDDLLQLLVNGLVTGSVISIAAVGLTLVYGILGIVNFAHGDFLAFGAFMAFWVNVGVGMNIALAALFAIAVTAALGLSLEYTLWRPVRTKGAGLISLFIISIGVALVLRRRAKGHR